MVLSNDIRQVEPLRTSASASLKGSTKDALISQSPIVVFKAATVLQSLGVIASRVLLPSSDTQGEKRDRTYCPTTWNYAYTYDTPAQYSDQLQAQGVPSLRAHECVLAVTAQIPNKNPNKAHSANVDSASAVISGVMVSLTPAHAPKSATDPSSKSRSNSSPLTTMLTELNGTLSVAESFVEVSKSKARMSSSYLWFPRRSVLNRIART